MSMFAEVTISRSLKEVLAITRHVPFRVTVSLIIIGLFAFAAMAPKVLQTHDPLAIDLRSSLQSPSIIHWLGTDQLGRDLYSRIVEGTGQSLAIGLGATALSMFIAIVIGVAAALSGGVVDSILSRIVDVLFAIPTLLLALVFVTVFGPSLLTEVIAVGIGTAPGYACMIRGQMLAIKGTGYVEAAKVLGHPFPRPGLERASFLGAKLDFAYMHAMAAQACNFDDASLRNLIDATGSLFHGCSMKRTRFDNAMLSGLLLYQCDASNAVFDGAELQGSTINECFLPSASFRFAKLSQVAITKTHLADCSFFHSKGDCLSIVRPTSIDGLVLEGAHLPYLRLSKVSGRIRARALSAPFADLHLSNLASAELEQADLTEARLLSVGLSDANLVGAVLNSASIHSCQLDGADLSQASGESISITESTMRAAKLTGFRGRCAFVRDCDLEHADLSQAYLYRSMITGDPPQSMALGHANLEGSNLVQAYLAAGMTDSNLEATRAAYVRMNQSSLRDANLSGISPFQASFVKVDFLGAKITTVFCRPLSGTAGRSGGGSAERVIELSG
ncbi:pentapeptide repeat-containing protein [Bradyrhizobium sp. CCBAU 45321]|uniref:pentapeptide repeat-containing protein n=1 Tax=Bradyrhizobium sp. CCBAU 45321 TaxID=1641878 RepID=UPI002303E28C|nr:pentapeptide repeat-containing protein [Bradyrhizobium sp. CCBAU 45321]